MKNFFTCTALAVAAVLAVGSAEAADLPVKAPIYKAPVVAVWNWTGFYVGANVGYSWGHSNTDIAVTAGALAQSFSNSFDMDGWLGGLQAGYNWQSNNFVYGVEVDIQATGQKGDGAFTCGALLCTNTTAVPGALAIINGTYEQKLDWFGTARVRGGVTITPSMLAYITGGLAWGHVKTEGTLSGFSALGAVSSSFSDSDTKIGWTIGAGVEARLWENWTGKIEYLYMDLGTVDATATLPANTPPLTASFSSRVTDNILRVGLNYKF